MSDRAKLEAEAQPFMPALLMNDFDFFECEKCETVVGRDKRPCPKCLKVLADWAERLVREAVRATLAGPAEPTAERDRAVMLAESLGYDVTKFPMVTQIMRQHIGEAVAEERRALREIVRREFDHIDRNWPAKMEARLIAALDAREKASENP